MLRLDGPVSSDAGVRAQLSHQAATTAAMASYLPKRVNKEAGALIVRVHRLKLLAARPLFAYSCLQTLTAESTKITSRERPCEEQAQVAAKVSTGDHIGGARCPHARFPLYCLVPVSTGIHFSRRATHNSYVGAKSVGAGSNAPSLISISPVPSETPNSADPQDGQKCRASVAAFQFDVFPSTVTQSAVQMAFTVNGAPLSLRQVVQWHRPILTGGPFAMIRTEPQLQVAMRVVVMACSSSVRVCHYPNLKPMTITARRGIAGS